MLGAPSGQAKYQTIGDLNLAFPVSGTVTNYRRDLNLDTAVASLTYQFNGVTYLREIFSSPVDNVMVMRLSADQPGMINFTAWFTTPESQGTNVVTAGSDTLVLSGTGGGSGPGGVSGNLPWESRLRIVPQSGTVSVSGNTLVVTNADSAVLLIDAATAYKRYNDTTGNPTTLTTTRIAAAAAKSFDQLKTNHIAEHQRLFRRVRFDLGRTAASDAPTDQRLQNFKNGVNGSASAGALFPVRPLSPDLLLTPGNATGKSAGPLEQFDLAAVGQQIHDQHQHGNELLAGGSGQFVRTHRAVDADGQGAGGNRNEHRAGPLQC